MILEESGDFSFIMSDLTNVNDGCSGGRDKVDDVTAAALHE